MNDESFLGQLKLEALTTVRLEGTRGRSNYLNRAIPVARALKRNMAFIRERQPLPSRGW